MLMRKGKANFNFHPIEGMEGGERTFSSPFFIFWSKAIPLTLIFYNDSTEFQIKMPRMSFVTFRLESRVEWFSTISSLFKMETFWESNQLITLENHGFVRNLFKFLKIILHLKHILCCNKNFDSFHSSLILHLSRNSFNPDKEKFSQVHASNHDYQTRLVPRPNLNFTH